ncbi:MAG: agmatine deiminase family protein [Candidatus Amulumruptor caecigallinarius]|nr:agmatine deiminase family protein [Candidatus Amulumruptor caecigallinarius]
MRNDVTFYAEWESADYILLALPHSATDWNYILPEAIEQYRRLISALDSHGERCILLVANRVEAEKLFSNESWERVRFVELPFNDTWIRDYGPISVKRHDRNRLIDFGFNGWGLKFAADKDNLVNLRLAEAEVFPEDALRNRRSFILEGGSIETDGEGTLLTTTRCLLSPNRNGSFSKREIAEELERELGADHILWLDYGSLRGDDTDSHIDTLCRLAPENIIFFTGCRNADDDHFEDLLKMRAQLTLMRNKYGDPFNLVELPFPDPICDDEGNRLPATYANYLVTRTHIYMPTYNQPDNDMLACRIVKIAFPTREVVPVDCRTLIKQHGSLHCSTMQVRVEELRSR